MSPDDVVVTVVVTFGLLGGTLLHLQGKAKPIVVATWLATGLSALVFRYLGGISDSSIQVKGLKLAGSMAALLGVALSINRLLERQLTPGANTLFRKSSDIAGRWKWQWAEGRWRGFLDFTNNDKDLTFTGHVQRYDTGQWVRLYSLDEGVAQLIDGVRLELSCRVTDHEYDRAFRWESTEPLVIAPIFVGQFRVPVTDPLYPELRQHAWGFAMTKESS